MCVCKFDLRECFVGAGVPDGPLARMRRIYGAGHGLDAAPYNGGFPVGALHETPLRIQIDTRGKILRLRSE